MEVELGKVGRKPKYDFNKWFSGNVFHLRQGIDFDMNVYDFRVYVYMRAKRFGFKVKTSINQDVLSIQAVVSK